MEQWTSILVILYIIGTLTSLGNLLFIQFSEAEFKEIERRHKFETRLKHVGSTYNCI